MALAAQTKIRNFAIIAHVDHGKTTLVDAILKQSGTFRSNEAVVERVMDSNDLERERGITIFSKNASYVYKDVKFNIVDTPGHADFGSEVERALLMVDGVLLIVDAREGVMPQTKFVLRKAVERGLAPIVVLNKMDRPYTRPAQVVDDVSCLLIDLGADEKLLDFPVLYASAKAGWASTEADKVGKDLGPLFAAIRDRIPPPKANIGKPLQMQVMMLDHSNFLGAIGIGRIHSGRIKVGSQVARVRPDGSVTKHRITKLMDFAALGRREIQEAAAGDIVALSGIEAIDVSDTVADVNAPEGLPPLKVDRPTMSMEFMVNDSPFAGREGKYLTSRHLAARLEKEGQINVGMEVSILPGEGHFKVAGRGELHLSILIETMRREGYEMSVSRPEVIYRREDGVIKEPFEYLVLDIETEYQGGVFENLGARLARLQNMTHESVGRIKLEYIVAARCLLGFKNEFLTITRGNGIMYHSFHGYEPKVGDIETRKNGVLIAKDMGTTTAYAIYSLQDRSTFLVGPVVDVYPGMIVGQNSREEDMVVNPCKPKALTNMRSKSADDALTLVPHKNLTLEQAIEFIGDDELVEVTPKNLRLRKKILNHADRKRNSKRAEVE